VASERRGAPPAQPRRGCCAARKGPAAEASSCACLEPSTQAEGLGGGAAAPPAASVQALTRRPGGGRGGRGGQGAIARELHGPAQAEPVGRSKTSTLATSCFPPRSRARRWAPEGWAGRAWRDSLGARRLHAEGWWRNVMAGTCGPPLASPDTASGRRGSGLAHRQGSRGRQRASTIAFRRTPEARRGGQASGR